MSLANHILIGAGVGVAIWFVFFNKASRSGGIISPTGPIPPGTIPGSGQGFGGSALFGILPDGSFGNLGVPVPGSQLAQEAADLQNSFTNGSYY